MTSRRAFLRRASAAALLPLVEQLPGRRLWAGRPSDVLPEADEALLRELALKAVDAARAAGAVFADVRVATSRCVSLGCGYERGPGARPIGYHPRLDLTVGYGVRAIVDGSWGFANGTELSADAVIATARMAVAMARGNRPRRPRVLELAPAPRATGAWATPIAQDPFTVSLEEQGELALTAVAGVAGVAEIVAAHVQLEWRHPTCVFADSNGSLLVQRLALALPDARVVARVNDSTSGTADGSVDLPRGGYGYEILGKSFVPDMREATDRALALARAAQSATSVDVGRYDLVLGPEAVAEVLATTLAEAVNVERALGYRANWEGTSFAAPPLETLGKYRLGSTLVTVHADRSQPHGAATTGWDDEGVKPENYTIVRDGVIVDYHTTRETALHLADWYRRQGAEVRSHGGARRTASLTPVARTPNLTLQAGAGRVSVDDLIADTKRGFYVEAADGAADQQVLNAQFSTSHPRVRRIVNGKLGGYVKDLAFQLITPQFWRSVDGLGDASSMRSVPVLTDFAGLSDKLQAFPLSTVRAVPLRVQNVNVLNIGRVA